MSQRRFGAVCHLGPRCATLNSARLDTINEGPRPGDVVGAGTDRRRRRLRPQTPAAKGSLAGLSVRPSWNRSERRKRSSVKKAGGFESREVEWDESCLTNG